MSASNDTSSPMKIHEASEIPQQAANQLTESDKTCVVCFKIVDIFSIGECDHPVCYECSTSMYIHILNI